MYGPAVGGLYGFAAVSGERWGGIRQMLEAVGEDDDSTLETIADRYQVSLVLVRHQYDNQIAT
jgi:hypothetical protein